jgi:hypothetical protein
VLADSFSEIRIIGAIATSRQVAWSGLAAGCSRLRASIQFRRDSKTETPKTCMENRAGSITGFIRGVTHIPLPLFAAPSVIPEYNYRCGLKSVMSCCEVLAATIYRTAGLSHSAFTTMHIFNKSEKVIPAHQSPSNSVKVFYRSWIDLGTSHTHKPSLLVTRSVACRMRHNETHPRRTRVGTGA